MLSVASVVEGSTLSEVARAVAASDDFEVSYETNPMGTIAKADDIDESSVAVGAAHKVVDGDRVSASLKIDDKRTREQTVADKVDAVEAHLGREARSNHE